MRRSGLISSDVVEGRYQARVRSLHLDRLKSATSAIKADPPARYHHLEGKNKPPPREQTTRNRTIQHDNGILVDKMVAILSRKPDPNHDPALLTKAAHATVEDAYRPGPIPLPKSLNKDARTRQLEAIVLENEKFLSRLISAPGVYNKKVWEKQYANETRYMEQISRFPYQDPIATMPQVNPILAIAHAQSDKSAEAILKQQHAMLTQQQQQLHQYSHPSTLPPLSATPNTFHQTQGFGSTFGSTSSSLPPFLHHPHHPLPSVGQPVPPMTARPQTSTTPKLRAQYTSQGVRIIKTGRHGGIPVHRSTSPVSMAARRHSRSVRYQPLRAQFQQELMGITNSPSITNDSNENEQKEEHEVSHSSIPQQQSQHSLPHADSTKTAAESSDSNSTQQSQSASTDSKPIDSSSNESATTDPLQAEAPPPADSSLKLFEDTLVISGRPVLIKIFECGGPWRLELRVFDPWSALEYTLNLPLSYIRLCFYQVPDLLLRANRGFLLQTLLHYLAFAPGRDGALELLVDIVAPPPRNPIEEAAWTKAHDQAAIEQAQAELEAEKANIAAQHAAVQEAEAEQRRLRDEERRKEEEEFERAKQDPKALAALAQKLQQEQEHDNTPKHDGDATVDPSASFHPTDLEAEETFTIRRGGAVGRADDSHFITTQTTASPTESHAPSTSHQTQPSSIDPPPSSVSPLPSSSSIPSLHTADVDAATDGSSTRPIETTESSPSPCENQNQPHAEQDTHTSTKQQDENVNEKATELSRDH